MLNNLAGLATCQQAILGVIQENVVICPRGLICFCDERLIGNQSFFSFRFKFQPNYFILAKKPNDKPWGVCVSRLTN